MTAPQGANPVTTLANTIGQYFTVVSFVPGLLLVAFITLLAESGAWNHEPNFGHAVRELAGLGFGGTFLLVLAGIAVGIVLHPLQLALVQFLEGYWGPGPFWSALRTIRTRHHVERRISVDSLLKVSNKRLQEHDKANVNVINEVANADRHPDYLRPPDRAALWSTKLAFERLVSAYPADVKYVMPTRLGNALRAAETNAGAATGLDIIAYSPHLLSLAPSNQQEYVTDQRTALDLALRTCLVCLLAFAAAVLYLSPHRLWLLVSLIPLGLAWLCYQGAITAVREYGAALRMVLDLNRFTLYEKMGLPRPVSLADEQQTVSWLNTLSANPDKRAVVPYPYREPGPAPKP